MSLHVLLSGVLREVAGLYKFQDGSLRNVSALYKMQDENLRLAMSSSPVAGASSITLSLDPTDVYAFGSNLTAQGLTTNPTTATPTGGAAPYSYVWTIDATVTDQGKASTAFAKKLYNTQVQIAFTCTVTDRLGQQAAASGTAEFEQRPSKGGNFE